MTYTSLRARAAIGIAAPLSPRVKWRLVLAITTALTRPSRSMPVLRRIIRAATAELRSSGLGDDQICELFAKLIEDIASERGLDATSIMSGTPRSTELTARVTAWIGIAG